MSLIPSRQTVRKKYADKVSDDYPVGMWIDELEGRFAGSKYFTYYVPKGTDKTEVHVVGEWVSPTIPTERLKELVKEYLDQLYNEDKENIDSFKSL